MSTGWCQLLPLDDAEELPVRFRGRRALADGGEEHVDEPVLLLGLAAPASEDSEVDADAGQTRGPPT